MLGISVSKFHEFVPVVENKDPHRLYARLEQTPSESHLQNSKKHTAVLCGRTYFFNDEFGRLTGTESLFRGVRVAVIFHLDNSPYKSSIHGITDKLMTDIHSTLRCQFMRFRSTASV